MSKVLVISDTNIFLDLLVCDMLAEFFALPYDIYTTDFIIEEIELPEQMALIKPYIQSKKLTVEMLGEETLILAKMKNTCSNNVSLADCSVWYLSKQKGGMLLTGDKNLRKAAKTDGVRVSGILYIFDEIVSNDLLTPKEAAKKLRQLMDINHRLPQTECELRIARWNE